MLILMLMITKWNEFLSNLVHIATNNRLGDVFQGLRHLETSLSCLEMLRLRVCLHKRLLSVLIEDLWHLRYDSLGSMIYNLRHLCFSMIILNCLLNIRVYPVILAVLLQIIVICYDWVIVVAVCSSCLKSIICLLLRIWLQMLLSVQNLDWLGNRVVLMLRFIVLVIDLIAIHVMELTAAL